jgi:hypothetical protein
MTGVISDREWQLNAVSGWVNPKKITRCLPAMAFSANAGQYSNDISNTEAGTGAGIGAKKNIKNADVDCGV